MNAGTRKQRAAQAATAFLRDGMTVGVGTGSTVNHFIAALAGWRDRITAAVSSSEASTRLLREAGIEVVDLNSTGDLELYVDGADEATRDLHLVKGGGGALTREKIVAAAARRFVCIVDEKKVVERLGAFPLPVEVIPMARAHVARQLAALGGEPAWREGVVTDNGNHILDVHRLDIADPVALEGEINQIAGVIRSRPKVSGRRGGVVVEADVETASGVDVPQKAGEIVERVRFVVEEGMGLKLTREPRVMLRALAHPGRGAKGEAAGAAPAPPPPWMETEPEPDLSSMAETQMSGSPDEED